MPSKHAPKGYGCPGQIFMGMGLSFGSQKIQCLPILDVGGLFCGICAMLDLHCHILFDVDDGAPDLPESLAMARALHAAGFETIAASPHFGAGHGRDVSLALAS